MNYAQEHTHKQVTGHRPELIKLSNRLLEAEQDFFCLRGADADSDG